MMNKFLFLYEIIIPIFFYFVRDKKGVPNACYSAQFMYIVFVLIVYKKITLQFDICL